MQYFSWPPLLHGHVMKPIIIALAAALAWVSLAHAAAAQAINGDELECLALAMYFEARSEPIRGQIAVAHVVLNRVRSGRCPNTICGVVQQGGEDPPCQFAWWCDGKSDHPANNRVWMKEVSLARRVLAGKTKDPTHGALYFVGAAGPKPAWTAAKVRTTRIATHVYYKDPPDAVREVAKKSD
jgi:spore germination cell wall hydrolase CwlJ-like protein